MVFRRLGSLFLFLCLSVLGGVGATTAIAQEQIDLAQFKPQPVPPPPVHLPPPIKLQQPNLGGSLPPITSPGGNNPLGGPPSLSTSTVLGGCPPNCPDGTWTAFSSLSPSVSTVWLEDRKRQLIEAGNAVHADLFVAPQQDYWTAYQLIFAQRPRFQALIKLVVIDIYVPVPAAADAAMREVVVTEAARGLKAMTRQVLDIVAAKMQQDMQLAASVLWWDNESERANKLDLIRRAEAEMSAYHRAARDELEAPERFQRVYESEPTRGGVYYGSGTAMRQLGIIDTSRLWKNQ